MTHRLRTTLYHRMVRPWRVWPALDTWRFILASSSTYIIAVLALGFATGLLRPALTDMSLHQSLRFAGAMLIMPAILEEFVFRGVLLPTSIGRHSLHSLRQVMLSLLLFVAWHPFNAALLLPEARPYFFRVDFLLIVLMLGITTTLLRYRTQSVWPGVCIHWLTVIGWKLSLGGPVFF